MKILKFKDYKLEESEENREFFGMTQGEFLRFLKENLAKISLFNLDSNYSIHIYGYHIKEVSKTIKIRLKSNINYYISILEEELGCFLTSPNLSKLFNPTITFEFDGDQENSYKEYVPRDRVRSNSEIISVKYNCQTGEDFIKIVEKSINSLFEQLDNPSVKVDRSITVNKTIKKNIEESFINEYKKIIDHFKNREKDLLPADEYIEEIGDLLEDTILKSIYEDPSLKKEFDELPLETRKLIFKNLDGQIFEPTPENMKNLKIVKDAKAFLKRIYA